MKYDIVSASSESIFEIVAWQKMNTQASNCLIMSVYIYSILFPSSKYNWGPSIVRRMRTTANLYMTLPQTITCRHCRGNASTWVILTCFFRYIGMYEARDFLYYFSRTITWFLHPVNLFLKLWRGKR